MFVYPLSGHAKPSLLFRAECSSNTSFREGYLARDSYPLAHGGGPCSDGKTLEGERETDIIVIAVWVEHLLGVYSAEEVAARLGYSDNGLDPHRKLWHHRDEYLVEGGIAADEYRIITIFKGGGPEHDVVFEYPFYRIQATILSGFFHGRRSNNVLVDIEDEIYSRSGVRDDIKRDQFVKAITGTPQFLFTMQYKSSIRARVRPLRPS
ncbi:hypothetical protein BO71DRAFT_374435 [Aspergillus ellipticus CBS 707.79]|uniref:Uncharacterized protein n=1 Tax=Aspergillus ellipticus CBS 707.79 TaxID=1448320 RepID=A0A319DHW4_9EURO|nr:hypothetical protein BO71DRAFT_374435 [Aspergillus ellipticus CBS 707.79]